MIATAILAPPRSVYIVITEASAGAKTLIMTVLMWEVNIWQGQYVPYTSFSLPPFVFKTREWGNQFFSVISQQHIAILPLPKIIISLQFFNCCCTQVYCENERIKWPNLLSYSNICSLLHSSWDQHFMRKGTVLMTGRKAAAKKQMPKFLLPFSTFFHGWWLCRIAQLLYGLDELTWYSSLDTEFIIYLQFLWSA